MNQLKLIIVDDEPSILSGLKNAITWKDFGINVVGLASNGKQALDLILTHNPDIVITDICMPIMSGIELIENVKAQNLKIRFIIISGFDDFKYIKRAIQLGAQDYLLKPLHKEELLDLISHIRSSILNQNNEKIFLKHEILSNLITTVGREQRQLYTSLNNYGIQFPLTVCVLQKSETTVRIEKYLQFIKNEAFDFIQFSNNQIIIYYYKTNVTAFCSTILNQFKEAHIGIGNPAQDAQMVYNSYQSAKQYLEYKIYDIKSRLYTANLIQISKTNKSVQIDESFKHKIYSAILNCNEQQLKLLIAEFMRIITYTNMPPPEYLRGVSINLMFSVCELMPNSSNVDIKKTHAQLCEVESLEAFECYIYTFFENYLLLIKSNKDTSPSIDVALEYINRNLTDTKLSLEEVANHVHLSKNYFTALFKEKTKQSFINYVLEKKMQYAKDKLQNSDMTIQQIANVLGYEESRSFHRAFKRVTGTSPAYYKKLYK